MQVLNLIRPEKSDIKFKIIQFPDGEPHIVLNGIDRKDDLTVVCRVCNPTDLFILMQVGDILNRHSMKAEVVAKFAVWFVIFIILITLGLEMISAPNTIENVIGFFMVVATLYLSVRTKCLTAIKLERKHEK